jgi:hypothetical protein
MAKKFLDTSHPMFRPLWVRVLIVALCLGWAIVEFMTASPFWGTLFLGLGAYAGYRFLFDFPKGGA